MAIYNYEVINPTTNNKKPFLNKKGFFVIPVLTNYRFYIEAAITGKDGGREYFFLLSKTKFDNSCRLCNTDSYGRCNIKIRGEVKDYIERETKERGNIEIEYIESTDIYDVFSIT